MASAAQTSIALSNVIVKVSESLEKLEKFKLKKPHQDLFDSCYDGFFTYIKHAAQYCMDHEATFIYLGMNTNLSPRQIEEFLHKDQKLLLLCNHIATLASEGLDVCAVTDIHNSNL
jgi:hypothetical protein